ncbi:MAG: small multi-drug export protein [Candidatus Krumholzibacteria bacterium]|nr:small multi-drug export protein [Candidatus Krumholzibacteria bacterium]
MREHLMEYFDQLPPPLAVFLVAMLPVFELRGAIPAGYAMGMTNPYQIYALAVLGNFVPVLPILLLLGPAEKHLRRFRTMDRFFDWLFKRTVSRSDVIKRYESLGLILFVAIPLPMTGAWTGSVAAYLFKLPLRMAIPCIILGILIAGVVVSLVSQGVIQLWN